MPYDRATPPVLRAVPKVLSSSNVPLVTVKILVVCASNTALSPMAAGLLGSRLAGLADVTSAGSLAQSGEPQTHESVLIEHWWGTARRVHASRELDERSFAGTGLVLTADREQRGAVLRLAPPLVRRTFTLREAGRLAALFAPDLRSEEPGLRLLELVDGLAGARGRWSRASGSDEDLDDPLGRGDVAYARAAGLVSQAVDALVEAVLPAAAPGGTRGAGEVSSRRG